MTAPAPPPGARGSTRTRWIFLGVAAALLLATFALFAAAPRPDERSAVGSDATAVPVEVLEVAARPLPRTTRISGVIEARHRVQLVSETQGRVIELGAHELDVVEADQLLVQVDPLLAQVAVDRATAAVARAESQLSLARDERARIESLATRDAASASRRDQAVSAERVADANLREARASLAEARDQLAKKTVRAPFGGVLQTLGPEVGGVLRPGDPIGELLDVGAAKLELGVTDRQVVDLAPGQQVDVAVEAYPGTSFPGVLRRVGSAADARTKKFPLEVELPNPDGRLMPGMIARASLRLGDAAPIRAIPRDAALDQFGVRFVYVVAEEEGAPVARRRRVELRDIPFRPDALEILSGLDDGERIATSGIRALRDGARVAPRGAAALAGALDEEVGS